MFPKLCVFLLFWCPSAKAQDRLQKQKIKNKRFLPTCNPASRLFIPHARFHKVIFAKKWNFLFFFCVDTKGTKIKNKRFPPTCNPASRLFIPHARFYKVIFAKKWNYLILLIYLFCRNYFEKHYLIKKNPLTY